MANDVYANGMELACKAGSGKVIAAFPDVCMTPPENPATPPGVPVPYPDTAMASDTTKGSKQVKISGKEIMLKNQSYFKTLSGNEAGCAAKKGVVSSKIKGKVYFVKWSMDVKVEGLNVDRHLDLTTNNHGSPTANEGSPWPEVERIAPPSDAKVKPCEAKCKNKKMSKSDKDKLRRTKEYEVAQKRVNDKKKPIACPTCKSLVNYVSPDHIIPVEVVTQMPGFTCLSKEDKSKVVNHPDNFVGLCKSCNSSKSDTLWFRWKEHKKKGIQFDAELKASAQKLSGNLIVNLKGMIRSKNCV